ncbi:hypothetical protein NIIDMKKI_41640 [Mycobacterium kansasii]|uniref:Uncharacterized protein n=1 Tax=Mycobacterium kansasii TaxID=1768 RepID=A0A7G1IJX8_MYCKA|nr:hypothetical protein NIIDMKKI_41640 [Mycobacterium kansasii]
MPGAADASPGVDTSNSTLKTDGMAGRTNRAADREAEPPRIRLIDSDLLWLKPDGRQSAPKALMASQSSFAPYVTPDAKETYVTKCTLDVQLM